MSILLGVNAALRFSLELIGLAAIIYCGFQSEGFFRKIGVGVLLPLLMITGWAMFGSPAASYKMEGVAHILLELAVFGAPAVVLYLSGFKQLALLYAGVAIVNKLLLIIWNQ